jgi:hypothetical protein
LKRALDADRQKATVAEPAITVRHLPSRDGWARAETANFRVYHNQSKKLVQQVAEAAERTRRNVGQKWFGGWKEDWSSRCDIYLHATAQEYSYATGVPATAPGHSSIRFDGARILSRRIDLPCDDASTMLLAVLPHEATHVVVAGQFGERQIPRWADEGLAILSEPRVKIEQHRLNLDECRRERRLFSVRDLMQLTAYPEQRRLVAFYAQSASLVQFLAEEKGAPAFREFLRDAMKNGYDAALKEHYGFGTWEEVQQKWHRKVLATAERPTGTASAR